MTIPMVREWSFKIRNIGALRAGEDRIVYSAIVLAPTKRFALLNGLDALHGRADDLWLRVMTSRNFKITTAPMKRERKDR